MLFNKRNRIVWTAETTTHALFQWNHKSNGHTFLSDTRIAGVCWPIATNKKKATKKQKNKKQQQQQKSNIYIYIYIYIK